MILMSWLHFWGLWCCPCNLQWQYRLEHHQHHLLFWNNFRLRASDVKREPLKYTERVRIMSVLESSKTTLLNYLKCHNKLRYDEWMHLYWHLCKSGRWKMQCCFILILCKMLWYKFSLIFWANTCALAGM